MTQLSELAISDFPSEKDSNDMTANIVVGTPAPDSTKISVYVNSITPTANPYDAAEAAVTFDIVFSVGILSGDGCQKTYQVVKRIALDKNKLADEAMTSLPVSVVESLQTQSNTIVEAQQKADHKRRVRTLAGLE